MILLTSANVGTAPIFPLPFQLLWTCRNLQVRDIFSEQAKRHGATYIDLFQFSPDGLFAQNPDKHYASDGFHPNDKGYGVWCVQVEPILKKLFY